MDSPREKAESKDKIMELLMGKKIEMVGKVFNRLTVTSFFGNDNMGEKRYNCTCECGNRTVSTGYRIRTGVTKSCGCLNIDVAREKSTTHGESNTIEYNAYMRMHFRCYNEKSKDYPRYGGRGIVVCKEWHDVETFIKDMGRRPSKLHSLDRINNNKSYSKGNCKWSTAKEQANNRNTNKKITFNGETLGITEWSRKLGKPRKTLSNRLARGLSVEEAFTMK